MAGDATTKGRALALIGWVLLSLAPSLTAAFVETGTWYAQLRKPAWNPPGWLFGPVWTFLYISMGVAAWLVWKQGGWRAQQKPLALFVLQLLVNASWTPLFFGLRRPGWALLDIVLLLVAIVTTIRLFWNVSRAAAILLGPYAAWTAFATALNYAIWRLNS